MQRSGSPTILTTFGMWLLVLSILLPTVAQAQQRPARPESAPKAEDEAPKPARSAIPVAVIHEGDDPVGLKLALALKESFSASPLFRMAGEEERRVVVRLLTVPEFQGRPYLASGYSVVWLFAEGSDVLSFYLESRMGFAAPDVVRTEAEALTSRTDRVASRFAYLFE